MKNIELAKLVLKQAENDAEHFNMHYWAIDSQCGTVACLAGHALLQHGGYEFLFTNAFLCGSRGIYKGEIGTEAQQVLGLSDRERFARFGQDLFNIQDGTALDKFRTLIEESEGKE